jgi:hypothetical protein
VPDRHLAFNGTEGAEPKAHFVLRLGMSLLDKGKVALSSYSNVPRAKATEPSKREICTTLVDNR